MKLESLWKDRTRLAVAGACGVVLLVVLLLGVVSKQREALAKSQPNLGRPLAQTSSDAGSIAPLVNAQPQAEEADSELSAEDVASTARPRQKANEAPPPLPPPPPQRNYALSQIPYSDPAPDAAYWRREIQNRTPAPPPAPALKDSDGLRKSSVVFVRQSGERGPVARVTHEAAEQYLPAGTRLVARLEDAVSSAARTPAVAVIEYHYERDGEIAVPAGTRAIGELQQTTIRFHTLEFADGRQVKIDGTAVSLDHGPLKGQVSGSNRGKRMLARTLTGLGTTAAFLVGGGGYRLGGPIDNSILLRERVAQNVGMAGEQELMALGYGQNFVVTVAGNTRFYLVIQKPAREQAAPAHIAATVEELRELTALKQELANLNSRIPR